MVYVRSAALTHPGQRRPNNEDYVTFFEPVDEQDLLHSGRIYILADGVGGASKGERASQYAAQKILYEYYQHPDLPPEDRLRRIIRQASNEIHRFAEAQQTFMQMATTVVVAVIRNGTLQVAHVGDSRAYLMRNDQVVQLTRDHSTVGEMLRDGMLTEEEAMNFEGRNPLSRSLGGERDVRVDVTEPIKFAPGDRLLLVSDGFSRYASRADIRDLLNQGPPEDVVYRLVDYANQKGGADNISVVLVEGLLEAHQVVGGVHGQMPMPIDWETIPTEPSMFTYREKPKLGQLSRRKRLIAFVALALLILLTWFAISTFRREISPLLSPGSTPTQPSPLMQGIREPMPILRDDTELPTNTQNPLPLSQEVLETPTVSDPEPGVEVEGRMATVGDPVGSCRYTVRESEITNITPTYKNGDLSIILTTLFKNSTSIIPNYSYNTYVEGVEVITVKEDFIVDEPSYIVFEGDEFLLPEILESDCRSAEGEFTP